MKTLKEAKLEKEAAEYANKGKLIDPAYANGLFYGFTAGACSKWVEAEKIKAQIEVLKMTHLRLSVEGIYNADNTMVFTINELEQQLKSE